MLETIGKIWLAWKALGCLVPFLLVVMALVLLGVLILWDKTTKWLKRALGQERK